MNQTKSETISYKAGSTHLRGYLARPEKITDRRPGVIFFPEWWGVEDYIKNRANQLAELGYVALAADMYGEGKTCSNPNDAGVAMNAVLNDMDSAEARIKAALDCIKKQEGVDPNRIAAMGYCFGGAVALHAARIGLDLVGVVSFHGALKPFCEVTPGGIKAKILVCHGGADKFISPEEVKDFKEEMKQVRAQCEVVVYDKALHAFTNPAATERGRRFNLPLAYDKDADQKSWAAMQEFLEEIFSNADASLQDKYLSVH